jgi:hypothetical protein
MWDVIKNYIAAIAAAVTIAIAPWVYRRIQRFRRSRKPRQRRSLAEMQRKKFEEQEREQLRNRK